MSSRHDYALQAGRYDDTRRASPSIVTPLLEAVRGAPGPRLLDVGGGTGNYARAVATAGFEPIVADVAPAMLARARAKGLRVVRGDATALPLRGGAVDAVLVVSMLHLVPDWPRALAEARRVLVPGGRLAVMTYAREHLAVHWIFDYFPRAHAWVVAEHQTLPELLAELPGASWRPFEFGDLEDGSCAALCRYPRLVLDPGRRLQTSFFERLAARDPGELSSGLERLARDLDAGHRPDLAVTAERARYGDGAIVAWVKPSD